MESLSAMLVYMAEAEKMGEEKGREKWRLLAGQSNLVIILSPFSSYSFGSKTQGGNLVSMPKKVCSSNARP